MAEGTTWMTGLSPRVRGNQRTVVIAFPHSGTIPACAGEPRGPVCGARGGWDYPRVCGGTVLYLIGGQCHRGLSPRVRGNLIATCIGLMASGTIPACAGEP